MASKVLIVLSTGEKEKALTGLLYATNAIAHKWLEDVRVFFFGPFEKLLAEDSEIQQQAAQLIEYQQPMACKGISDDQGVSDQLSRLGVDVQYIGQPISQALNDGYVPMVF